MHTLNKHKEGIYAVALDNLHIVYTMNEDMSQLVIVKVLYVNNSEPQEKLRTKEWLEKMNDIMDFRGIKVDEPEGGQEVQDQKSGDEADDEN